MSWDGPPGWTVLGMGVALAGATGGALWLRRRTPGDWPVIVLLAGLCFAFALAFDGFLPDDSYITYRYAHNLLSGQGFVYNPGERVLSTTTPLYALLLSAVGVVWPDLPVTSHVLNILALFAGAFIMYRLCADHGRALVGVGLAALYILNPLTVAVYSSESIPHVALIWGTFYAWDRRAWGWAGLLGGLALVNRGDAALVAVVLGLVWAGQAWQRAAARRRTTQEPLAAALAVGVRDERGPVGRFLLGYALPTVPWFLFSLLYFGTLTPATLAAKMLQRGVTGTVVFLPGLAHWWNSYTANNPWWWPLLPLAALGLVVAARWARWAGPLLAWTGLYTLGYSLLQVPRYQNYYTPLVPVLLLLGLLGAQEVGRGLARGLGVRGWGVATQARLGVGVTLVLGGVLLLASWNGEVFLYGRLPQARVVVYEQVGRWLAVNTPAGATVGMLEVGTIGYYAERHVIDFYGLIQPDIAQHLGVNDQRWGVQHYQPDYIVGVPDWLKAWHKDPWFQATYEAIYTFPVYPRYSEQPVILFRRKGL